MRYLSFLCWAIRKTDNDARAIDRWEVALSMGEHYLHAGKRCAYLGSRLLQQRIFGGADPLPRRLHVQTARLLYSGLLRSCGLAHENGTLSDIGERIADDFGREMPRSMPKKYSDCFDMPCLSKIIIKTRETRLLRGGLLENGTDAERRKRTKLEIGPRGMRGIRRYGAAWLLKQYLLKPGIRSSEPARLLHTAARLELHAMPLTRLFLYIYQHDGRIVAKVASVSTCHPYRVREPVDEMLGDVVAHIRRAATLGELRLPHSVRGLKMWVLRRHREAKAEAPWVDEDWRVLRLGLHPQQPPGVHEYRLGAFASLLHDLEKS
jgi:hypothetical protein